MVVETPGSFQKILTKREEDAGIGKRISLALKAGSGNASPNA